MGVLCIMYSIFTKIHSHTYEQFLETTVGLG